MDLLKGKMTGKFLATGNVLVVPIFMMGKNQISMQVSVLCFGGLHEKV